MQQTTKFVAACCRWPQDDAAKESVLRAARAIDDWDETRDVVMRHRVVPLVYLAVKNLDIVPIEFRDWAKQGAQSTARHAMQMTQECLRIDAAFRKADLQPLHFKGPVLAQIAFGSIALKFSCDLDIFVPEDDVIAAVAILEADGYRAAGQTATMSARQIRALICNFKDIGLVGPNGTFVELHWKFGHSHSLLAGLERDLERQNVQVAGMAGLDTFGAVQMVTYLCIHGAAHHWRRLKWLADLAAFLEHLPKGERDRVIETVRAGPARDILAQSLGLCDTFFGTNYQMQMSARARSLYDYALGRIDQPFIPPRRFWGDIDLIGDILAKRHLYPSAWAALRASRVHLIGMQDVLSVPLPRALNALYLIMRLPSLLVRRLMR
ncbi:nucleotidyltransferase family protein [Octadecabacter sp. G9-8]|uniref:Nucleotidyltransferase family protein n=1 Tax=Octadecabacter dasysiphoniae TaxID=2909341 RepID=A0ABS9D171_9RHOB|nr:nucleotidyltransferase family protein [Octadecabacter dasysiphoniae]MCF2872369.1 nucleotidyltransferase family protein [Octadecabacter dasysiphoniae]